MCAVAAIGSGVSASASTPDHKPPGSTIGLLRSVVGPCDTRLITHRRTCSDQTRYACCAGSGAMRSMPGLGEGARRVVEAV